MIRQRRLAVVLILALIILFSHVIHTAGPHAAHAMTVAAAPTPATSVPVDVATLHPQTVITDIGGILVASSTRANRIIEVGTDLNGPQQYGIPHGTFAVIDTKRHRVVTRQVTPGSIDATAIDDTRSLGYVSVAYTVNTGTYQNSFRLDLWRVDLRSGRTLARMLLYEGEALNVVSMAVDSGNGHVLVTTTHGSPEATNDLFVVDPVAQMGHLDALEGVPNTEYVDTVKHLVVVSLQMHAPNPGQTVFAGFDTRAGTRLWTRTFAYGIQNNSMAFDPRAGHLWYEAPGGLVTVLNAATGTPAHLIQMGYNDPNGLGTPLGFTIDTARDVGYLRWASGSTCTIDAANARGGTRHSIYQGSIQSCYYSYNDFTPVTSVNSINGMIQVAAQSGISLFSSDGSLQRQYLVSDQSGIGSAQQQSPMTVLQDGIHTTVVLLRTVPHQNQVSGAATTGAVAFVQVG